MSRLARLAMLIDRYGEAIEYDLHTMGLDILDFFRHRLSWRKLDVILARLPAGSAFWAARADDDEAAKATIEAHGIPAKGDGAPALADMSLANQLVLTTNDLLLVLVDRMERLGGGTPTPPKPTPRPRTAWQRAEKAYESARMDLLLVEVAEAQTRNNN